MVLPVQIDDRPHLSVVQQLFPGAMINESWGYQPERPRTVPFDDKSYAPGSDDMRMDRAPLKKTASEVEPEQIHIALAGEIAYLGKNLLVEGFVWDRGEPCYLRQYEMRAADKEPLMTGTQCLRVL